MSPLEDLYQTRTRQDRKGTVLDEWNRVLLFRDLDRLIKEGAVERTSCIREISPDLREKIWYRETSTGNVYVYVAGCERGSPEFRKHTPARSHESSLIQ